MVPIKGTNCLGNTSISTYLWDYICDSRIVFHESEIRACDKHTWRQIKCLFGIQAALENLPHIDALAIDWLSLRDQEFGLGEPEESGFHLHPEELPGKEHPVECKGHRNSSKEKKSNENRKKEEGTWAIVGNPEKSPYLHPQ